MALDKSDFDAIRSIVSDEVSNSEDRLRHEVSGTEGRLRDEILAVEGRLKDEMKSEFRDQRLWMSSRFEDLKDVFVSHVEHEADIRQLKARLDEVEDLVARLGPVGN